MKAFKRIPKAIFALVLITAIFAGAFGAQAVFGEPARAAWRSEVQIPAEIIFQQSADAVFLLEMFDRQGDTVRTGSGFFISKEGLAVTNLHVIQNAASATITLYNGDVYPVRGVHAMSEAYNLCIISIDSDENDWDFLPLANSDRIEAGNSVYSIGSPLGYVNTMSAGIVANANRDVDGERFIQFTAPISFGSGGSPVLDALGRVVGVASSSFSYGQKLNLAVPINYVGTMRPGESVSLDSLLGNE